MNIDGFVHQIVAFLVCGSISLLLQLLGKDLEHFIFKLWVICLKVNVFFVFITIGTVTIATDAINIVAASFILLPKLLSDYLLHQILIRFIRYVKHYSELAMLHAFNCMFKIQNFLSGGFWLLRLFENMCNLGWLLNISLIHEFPRWVIRLALPDLLCD